MKFAYISVSTKLLGLPKGVKQARIFIEDTFESQKGFKM